MIAEQLQSLAVPIASLNLDPSNARVHGDKNLAAIRSSLAQFGQRKPVVVQRAGMIVRAGNGTVQAAKALGWTEVAVLRTRAGPSLLRRHRGAVGEGDGAEGGAKLTRRHAALCAATLAA